MTKRGNIELIDEVLKLRGEAGQRTVRLIHGLHTNTVRRWADQGKLKAYRLGDRGDRRFRREDVEAFSEEEGDDWSC